MTKSIDRKLATVGLTFVNGVGPKMFEKLMVRFGYPEKILSAPTDELCKISRLTPMIADVIHNIDLDAIETELMAFEEFGINVTTIYDEDYPQNLKMVSDAPSVLFKSGDFLADDNFAVAIVGTRKPKESGKKMAEKLAFGLAKNGFTIVSGLALGIDTAAHQGALEAGGRTIAVLGSGMNIIHPSQNRGLAEHIRQSGAIFSELHPNTRPSRGTLMSRDRITSGLALGTIVVECSENSGTMDTAKKTEKQNRKLFAVVNKSKGNKKLLEQGAYPIEDFSRESLDKIAEIIDKSKIEKNSNDRQQSLFS